MTVTAANFLSLSVEYLKAMIGVGHVWRAIVAQPDADWPTLATLIAAQTSSQNDALAKILKHGAADDSGHTDYKTLPRCIVRHPDMLDMIQIGTSSYGVEGMLIAVFEIPVPTAYRSSFADASTDFANKIGGIIENLEALGAGGEAGYLDIQNISLGQFGEAPLDEENGVHFFGAELMVTFRGGR